MATTTTASVGTMTEETGGAVANGVLEAQPDRATSRHPAARSVGVRAATPGWWVASILAITGVQFVVRVWSVLGLDSYHDDVAVTYRALDSPLSLKFLTGTYAGHWGPVDRFLEWTTVHAGPFNPGVSFGVVLGLLLVADVGMALLLRRLFGAAKTSVFVYLFWAASPVLVTTLGSWSLGLLLTPLVGGMAWATFFYVGVMTDGRVRRQLGALVSFAVLLLVSPQALFVVPFLFLFTVAYPGLGGPAPTLRTQTRRVGVTWLGYGAILVGYVIAYLSADPVRSSRPLTPQSFGEAFGGLWVTTAAPAMVGGPWASDPGSLPSVAELSPFAVSVVLQLMVAVVVLTLALRRGAWRAWAVLLVLALMNIALVATAVRSDLIGGQLLRQTRYLVPLLVPACVLLGAAFAYGPRRTWFEHFRATTAGRVSIGVVSGLAALLMVESAWLTTYHQVMAMKQASTASYWGNVRQSFAANPGVSIVDRPMPSNVLFPGFLPEVGAASEAVSFFVTDQQWDAPAETLHYLTDDGRLVPAQIAPFAVSQPGTAGCGYLVAGNDWVTIPMDKSLFNFGWGVRLNYLAAADTSLQVKASGKVTDLDVLKGIGSVSWVNPGIISEVKVRSTDPAHPAVCVDQITVGGLLPT